MEHERKNTVVGRVAIGGLFVAFTLLLMVTFYNSNESVNSDSADTANQQNGLRDQRGQNVSLGDVTQNPEGYYGQLISVRGEVSENRGVRGISIRADGLANGSLLVISRTALVGIGGGPGDFLYSQDDDVAVSGVVREFNIAEIESELGIDLDDEEFRQYNGQPVVVADSVAEIREL